MSLWHDAGWGVEWSFARCMGSPDPCLVIVRHQHDGSEHIAAVAPLAVPCRAGQHEHWWFVSSMEPLTIAPSIVADCGLHGHITDGLWVPASENPRGATEEDAGT